MISLPWNGGYLLYSTMTANKKEYVDGLMNLYELKNI